MGTTMHSPRIGELIHRLDQAVAAVDDETLCRNVKQVLSDAIADQGAFLDPAFLVPAPDRYARRLLHRDPAGRYTVVIMVWDRGQGTPLHDHSGMWCVESVYQGRIRVTSYDLEGTLDEDPLRFAAESVILAGRGESGHLIPPFEYHTLENAEDTPAVTIHVYGGEMTTCSAFFPVEGGYRRELRPLSYTA